MRRLRHGGGHLGGPLAVMLLMAPVSMSELPRRAGLLALVAPQAVQAAIPTMEEFYQGSGSQVTRPKEEVQAAEAALRSAWAKQKGLSLAEAAKTAVGSLRGVPDMLKAGDFDGVRTLLLSPSVGSIGIVKSPLRVGGTPFGAWATECSDSKCESSALVARGALQELEEWCFSKRTIYFNSADKQQVESRETTAAALQKVQADLEEPLEFLEQAKGALEEGRIRMPSKEKLAKKNAYFAKLVDLCVNTPNALLVSVDNISSKQMQDHCMPIEIIRNLFMFWFCTRDRSRDTAGLDKLRAIIQGNLGFIFATNCTTDDIREVLGKYKRESAAKAGQMLGLQCQRSMS
eukprot:g17931.t1